MAFQSLLSRHPKNWWTGLHVGKHMCIMATRCGNYSLSEHKSVAALSTLCCCFYSHAWWLKDRSDVWEMRMWCFEDFCKHVHRWVPWLFHGGVHTEDCKMSELGSVWSFWCLFKGTVEQANASLLSEDTVCFQSCIFTAVIVLYAAVLQSFLFVFNL